MILVDAISFNGAFGTLDALAEVDCDLVKTQADSILPLTRVYEVGCSLAEAVKLPDRTTA